MAMSAARWTTCGMGSNPDVHPHLGGAEQQRVRHVVPVAQVGDRQAGELAALLADGEQIGQALARVLEVRQRVDHGNGRRGREQLQALLFERSHDDRIHVPRQRPTRVLDRLAAPELQLGRRQRDGVTACRLHGDVERDPRPGRGLLEDQGDRAPGQSVGVVAGLGLDLGGQVEQVAELARGQVVDRQEVSVVHRSSLDRASDGPLGG
jgi:hypothetical protein